MNLVKGNPRLCNSNIKERDIYRGKFLLKEFTAKRERPLFLFKTITQIH